MLSDTESSRSSRVGSLVTSFNELRATSEKQSREISQLTMNTKTLEAERDRMKERVKELVQLSANLKVDKDSLQADLRTKNAKLHAVSMELTIAQHQAREAGIRGGYHREEEEEEEMGYRPLTQVQSRYAQEIDSYPAREVLKAELMLKKLLSPAKKKGKGTTQAAVNRY